MQIPEGYTLKNLQYINIFKVHKDGDEPTMGFVSKYQQKGNTITIDIEENYQRIKYPISQFEDFTTSSTRLLTLIKLCWFLEKI